jgi:hypothetical protein
MPGQIDDILDAILYGLSNRFVSNVFFNRRIIDICADVLPKSM